MQDLGGLTVLVEQLQADNAVLEWQLEDARASQVGTTPAQPVTPPAAKASPALGRCLSGLPHPSPPRAPPWVVSGPTLGPTLALP